MANTGTAWNNNHPKLTWDANTEIDVKHYEIYKKYDTDPAWPTDPYATSTTTSYTDEGELKYSLGNEKKYVYYKMKAVDYQDNKSPFSSIHSFAISAPQQNVIAFNSFETSKLADYILAENYPNPFNPETKISFGLPEQSTVSLKVYNIQGQVVATLADGVKQDGYYTASFDGSNLSSGVYIYRFAARGLESGKAYSKIKRMLLIK